MTDSAIQWLAVLSILGMLVFLATAWIEADAGRTAAVERFGYRIFGDGPR